MHGFVLAVIQEPWFRPGIMSAAIPMARTPVGRDAAWFHRFVLAVIWEPWFRLRMMYVASRGLTPLWGGMGHGCRGFVLAVIRAPMLLIDSAGRLIEIRDSSNFPALNPA